VPTYHSKAEYSTAINCWWSSPAQLYLALGPVGTNVFENCLSSSIRRGLNFMNRLHNCCTVISTNWLSAELRLGLACPVSLCSGPNGSHDKNLFSGSLHSLIQEECDRTRTSTKHGTHRKHCFQQLPYCLMCTRCLLMGWIYELCHCDGLRCCDMHTKFHKDWFR
jgi:hypothetical protein